MSQLDPMTQAMNVGTLSSAQKASIPETVTMTSVDGVFPGVSEESEAQREFEKYRAIGKTIRAFKDDIETTKAAKLEWLEVDPQVISHFNPKGTGAWGYFIYEGVKCCEKGKLEEVQENLSKTAEERTHGKMA